MPPPIPSKSPTVASPPAPALAMSAGGGQHQIVVRYYRRMKPQRVYPLVVELRPAGKKATPGIGPMGDTVKVRPQIPGCFITPPELEAIPKGTPTRSVFQVTPLAKGRLRDAQVGVYHQGRLLQEVRLGMKSVTQCMTRWLLVLAVVAPLFIWWATSYLDLSGMGPINQKTGAVEEKAEKAMVPDHALKADEPAADVALKEAAPKQKAHGPLANAITGNVPEYEGYTKEAALKVQEGYDIVRTMQKKDNLSFWVCVAFLGLAFLSLVTHRQTRGKRKGKPLVLPAAATTPDFGGSDALSFNIPAQPMR